jgi:iron complex transport system ATP-binding protein
MSPPLLECRRLSLCAGDRLLVQDLVLQIDPGQRWALVGPNGAGKSSLLAALSGALKPSEGEVRVAGRAVTDWGVQALAAHRSLVGDRWLDPFAATVIDTVLTARYRFGTEAGATDIALSALEQMDCIGLAGHDIRGLSRGERQRVAIATALAQDTPLLLLDEPTSHQDPAHQTAVLRRLAARTDRSIVAALHDLNAAARFATHALLLSGRGAWQAGAREHVLTTRALSDLFGARIRALGTDHRDVFWVDEDA